MGCNFACCFVSVRNLVADGRIILRWIFRMWDVGGKDWIELA